jgi:hypothetical protein
MRPPANRVAELFRPTAKSPAGVTSSEPGLYKVLQVVNIHEFGPQHNVAWTLLPALMIPEHGTSLHTLAAAGGVKVLANVDMRPSGGLDLDIRRDTVKFHDICQVFVHADIHDDAGELPVPADFHAPTLFWALEHSFQIAVWVERGISRHADVVGWMVDAAHAGSRFQTTINARPENAVAWLAHVDRWRGRDAELRVFGREALQ